MTLHKIILDHRWTLLALLGLVVLNYAAAVHSGYMIDDYLFLEGRYAAGYGGYLDFLVRTESQHYSPLYFAVNYFLFEYLRELPQLMTVVNMVLFYLNLVMFFLLTKMWTKSIPLASLTVLLMAMHPFNAFPITYRTANFIFYGALFQQLSLYFIWHAWHQTPGIRWARTWSLLFFSAALLSNEWAILMPLYALLVLSVFVDAKDLPKTLKITWPLFAVAGLFGSLYLLLAGPRFSIVERLANIGLDATDLGATALSFAGWYISRLIYPEGLVFMINRISLPHPLLVYSLFFAGVAILFSLLRGKRTILVASLAWFCTGFVLVPLAMLGHPSLGPVFEPHWLYFSSYGFFLLLANLLLNIYRCLPRVVSYGLTICLVLGWMLTTHMQLRQLRDEKTYCQYLLRLYPGNQMAKSTLANIYFREGNHGQAKALYEEILAAGDCQHFRELNNLGLIYHDLEQFDLAVQNLRAALALNPDFAPAWNNLGQVFRDRGDPIQAIAYFEKAVALEPHLPAARLNLANSYIQSNRWALAAETLADLNISSLKPFYQREALMQLCVVTLKQKNAPWSQDLLGELQARFPSAETQLLLAQKLIDARLSVHAGPLLEATLSQYPENIQAYLLWGAFLGNHHKWDEAIAVWDAGRARFPEEPLFSSYIAEAQKLRGVIPSGQ